MESGARNIIFIVKKLRKLAKYVKKGIFFKNINTCQQYKTQSFIVIFIQKKRAVRWRPDTPGPSERLDFNFMSGRYSISNSWKRPDTPGQFRARVSFLYEFRV